LSEGTPLFPSITNTLEWIGSMVIWCVAIN
jgi:hypothetical protein